MPNNFNYAALSYLDQWMFSDRIFHEKLRFESRSKQSADSRAKTLVKFATEYGVIRTLKVKEGEPRLGAALNALDAIEQPKQSNVVEEVERLAKKLGDEYCVGRIPLSAASKFLWIRFRSPVIICDKLAAAWLHRHADYADNSYSTYADYYQSWQFAYGRYEEQIREACVDLIRIKKLTLAIDESDKAVIEWTSSRWFQERVFDFYMLNASTFERLGRKS